MESGTETAGRLEANKQLVGTFIDEVLNKHNYSVADEICAEDHVLHHPAQPGPVRGRQGLKDITEEVGIAFPDWHMVVKQYVAEGDWVAAYTSLTATNTGPLSGGKPSGKAITQTGITFYRVVDGKIVEVRIREDILYMLQGLGAIPNNLPFLQIMNRIGVVRLLQKLGKIPS
jgi:predicted ester cyclase